MKSSPVVIMGAVLTILNIVAAGITGLDIMPEKWAAVFMLLVAAITAGWTKYTHDQVTPLSNPQTNDGVPLVPLITKK